MKTEALKLADELSQYTINDGVDDLNKRTIAMIRRLVEELDEKNYRILELTKRYKALTWTDKQTKPLSDEEIKELSELTSDPDPTDFVRAIEERHGIHVQKT